MEIINENVLKNAIRTFLGVFDMIFDNNKLNMKAIIAKQDLRDEIIDGFYEIYHLSHKEVE